MFGFGTKKEEEPATFEQTFTLLVNNVKTTEERARLVEILNLWRPLRTQIQRYTSLDLQERKKLATRIVDFIEFIEKLEYDVEFSRPLEVIRALQYAKKSAVNIQRNFASVKN